MPKAVQKEREEREEREARAAALPQPLRLKQRAKQRNR